MAIGLITTPSSWLTGTVAPNAWFQNVQDTLNNLYTVKSTSFSMWIPASMMQPTSAGWTLTAGSTVNKSYQASAANATLEIAIPFRYYAGSTTQYQKLTGVKLNIQTAGASAATLKVFAVAPLNTGVAPQQGSTISSTGTGAQYLNLTGLSVGPSDSQWLTAIFSSGQTNDAIYSALLTYSDLLF